MIDIIVVGSGAAGSSVAHRLVEAGISTLMLDVGADDAASRRIIPHQNFMDIRREDEQQASYFLGEKFEGVPLGDVRVGAQLTPPRQFLYREAQHLLPVFSETFHPMQSLALGGLAAGWGAAVPPLNDDETLGWPVTARMLEPYYRSVGARIGICGTASDDLRPFLGPADYLLPAPAPDENGAMIERIYKKRRGYFNRRGVSIGAPRLAMATIKHDGRGPFPGTDMEFWADHARAVYRPRYTVERLKHSERFRYDGDALVVGYRCNEDYVEVDLRRPTAGTQETVRCRHLVLCAGTLSTARLVLKNSGDHGLKLPILCNPYTYFPCLLWPRLGQQTSDIRHSLTQLMMIYEPSGARSRAVQAQFYSYRSLMTFKLLKEVPLAMGVSRRLLQLFLDYFVIAGVHQEDRPSEQKYLRLTSMEDSAPMEIVYQRTLSEKRRRTKIEGQVEWFLYHLGLLPLKRIDPGDAASIHYAGATPMRRRPEPHTTDAEGILYGQPRVRIADGSVLPHLPAKGLTFTVMANAERIGHRLADSLR